MCSIATFSWPKSVYFQSISRSLNISDTSKYHCYFMSPTLQSLSISYVFCIPCPCWTLERYHLYFLFVLLCFLSSSKQYVHVCSVAQSCLTLCDPLGYKPPGSSVNRILQARILEWVALPSSRVFSQSKGQTQASCVTARFFSIWTTMEAS